MREGESLTRDDLTTLDSSGSVGELTVETIESTNNIDRITVPTLPVRTLASTSRMVFPTLQANSLGDIKRLAQSMVDTSVKTEASAQDTKPENNLSDSNYTISSSVRGLCSLSLSLSVSMTKEQRVKEKLEAVEGFLFAAGKPEGENIEINAVKLSEILYSKFPELKPRKPQHIQEKFTMPTLVRDIAKHGGYFMSNFYDLIELDIINVKSLLSKPETAGIIPEYIKYLLVDASNNIDPNAVLLFSSKFLHEVLNIYKDQTLEGDIKKNNSRRLRRLKTLTQNKVKNSNVDINSGFVAKVLINIIKTYVTNNQLENSTLSYSSCSSERQLLSLLGASNDEDYSMLKTFRESNIVLMIDEKLVKETLSFLSAKDDEKLSIKFLMINTNEGSYKGENFECIISEERLKYLENAEVFEFFKKLGLSCKQILTAPIKMLELLNSPLHELLINENIEKSKIESILNKFFELSSAAPNRMREVAVVAQFLDDLFRCNNIKPENLKDLMEDISSLQQGLNIVKSIFNHVIKKYPELGYHIEIKYGYVIPSEHYFQGFDKNGEYSKDQKPNAEILSDEVKQLIIKYPKRFNYLMHSGIINTALLAKLNDIEFSALLSILGKEWVKCVVQSGDFSYFIRLTESTEVNFMEEMLHYLGNHATDVKISQFITKEVPQQFMQRKNKRKVLEALVCGDLIKLDMLVEKNRFGLYCLMKAVSIKRVNCFLDFINSPIIQNYLNHLEETKKEDFKYNIFEHNTQYLVFLREVLIYANDNAKDGNARHNYSRLHSFISECMYKWSTLYQPFDRNTVVQNLILPFDQLFLPACAMLYYNEDCVTTNMIEIREKLRGSKEEQNALREMHMSHFLVNLVGESVKQIEQDERRNQEIGSYLQTI